MRWWGTLRHDVWRLSCSVATSRCCTRTLRAPEPPPWPSARPPRPLRRCRSRRSGWTARGGGGMERGITHAGWARPQQGWVGQGRTATTQATPTPASAAHGLAFCSPAASCNHLSHPPSLPTWSMRSVLLSSSVTRMSAGTLPPTPTSTTSPGTSSGREGSSGAARSPREPPKAAVRATRRNGRPAGGAQSGAQAA